MYLLKKPSLTHTCKARRNAFFAITAGVLTAGFCSLFATSPAYGTGVKSSIILTISDHELTANVSPGVVGLSETSIITVTSDNYTGYTLKVTADDTDELVSTNNDVIPSMTGSAVSASTYQSGAAYDNTFAFKPSQYVTTSGNTNTFTTNNTDFIPVPDETNGVVMDITSAPNSVANSYTIQYGIRAGMSQPAGTYTYEYVISVVGHESIYNITYNSNVAQGITVGNMPSPNPQAIRVDAGTEPEDSYGVLSSSTPTRTGFTFGGWCSTATTTDQGTGNDVCSGTTYQPGDNFDIDQTSSNTNITLYAIWLAEPFPIVWSQLGKCVFNNGVISGSECQDYVNDDFIDTGIALYSNDNYQKDYEVHFTLDTFNPGGQSESQATMFNDKLSSSVTGSPYDGKSPGIVVRITSSKTFEIKSTYGAPTEHAESRIVTKTPYATAYNGTDVRIFRIDGHIYTSVDNGPLIELQDYTSFNQQFGLSAWFGAYPDNVDCTVNCTAAKRYFTGEMSNMYIKLGDMPADRLHTITFDADGGAPATTTHLIVHGDALGELPEVANSGWLFGGWWTAQHGSGTQVSTATVPTATTTYYAYWYKSVSDAQITNTSIAMSVSDTETIAITNAADIEPYTLTSSDSNVATVSSAGVITAVGNGVATITMTGANTGDTRTISVTVGTTIDVDFDSRGGSPVAYHESVANGGSFASLPEPTRTGYTFAGWYTGVNGTGTQLTTSTVFDSNTPTQYYAKWDEVVYVCRVATSLHSEQCAQSGSNGCKGANWGTNWIEYGYLIADSSTVSAGAAYDCDVDFDGTYDPVDERFYYFGTENGNAKLIYYKNMANNASVAYTDAIDLLPNYELDANNPSVPVWDNPNLVRHTSGSYEGKAARFMTYPEVSSGLYSGGNNHITPTDSQSTYLFEESNFASNNATDGIWLEVQPNYNNRIQTRSRQLTHGSTSANAARPTIDVPTQYIEPYTPSTYTITFDPHNETASWDETINAGDDLTNAYPANDPTYANHIFKGWYTAQSGGIQISSSTVPSGTMTFHAQWRSMVDLAVFDNDHLTVAEGSTVAITITGPSDLEDHSFASNGAAIATVDSTTGVITGVAAGSTTITMTGTDSDHTRTIYIEVVPLTYVITFNPHNGTATWDETIDPGDDLTDVFPASNPTYAHHLFQGWFTAASSGTQISSSTMPSGDTTYHAQWLKDVTLATLSSNSIAVNVSDTSTITVTNSAELEPYTFSSLDSTIATVDSSTGVVTGVADGTTTIRMTGTTSNEHIDITVTVSTQVTMVCRLAVANSLHTGPNGDYGQIAENTTPQPGDAYDCDVNNDDNYNATNERFYYLGQDGNNNAVLVAWNSYYEGAWAPGTSSDNYYNYASALAQLPSNADGAWDNPGLIEQDTGKAARLMNYTEVVSACNNIDVTASGALDACDFLMEHSAYDSGGRSALWLNYDGSTYRRIHAGNGNHLVGTADPTTSNNMVRPAIVVPYNLIEKYVVPPAQQVTVTFNAMGGTGSVSQVSIDQGSALGTDYPSTDPTKTDNKFFGWYTDTTYNTEVTPETVVNSDVTYYAKWVGNTTGFPIVFSEINECIFSTSANLSGDYCTQPKNIGYVDSNVQLFASTNDNYTKDFEIGFTITEYATSSQTESQATLVNSKLEATGYPGFVIRRSSDSFQLTAKFAGATNSPIGTDTIYPTTSSGLKQVRIVRRDNVLYYAWNGGELTKWWDLDGFSTRFNTEVWFGAATNGSGDPFRRLNGRLTDMYIRLGTYEETDTYTIQFDPNGGIITSGSASADITPGDTIGSFPTVTWTNHTLVGWYDSSNNAVTTSTRPDRSQTYHAEWSYNSTKTPVTVDISNAAVTGYDTIVKSYAPQITTFNEADPINNSTWGVAKITYLGALQSNFETNNCMAVPQEDSQIDWGGSHTVNCSKPSSYDTGRSGGVNVYEYDIANDTIIGTALTYTKSSGGVITNLIPGHDYYWEDSSDSTIYGVISAVSSASDRRLLDVSDVWNVRDLGGLPVDSDGDGTVDGTIDYGKLVRGGRLNTTSSTITELQNLGIDKEYDLAGEGELSPDVQFSGSNYVNDEVIHYQFDYGWTVDNEDTYAMARKAVTDIMNDVIGDAQNNIPSKNVYFHCRVGADRTGTVAYILEGLLGVPDEHRYRDYELTSVSGLNDRTRYYAQKNSTNNKKFLFMMGYLQTKADIVAWYLKDTTDTGAQARIAAFKQAMIVSSASPSPAPAQQQQNLSNNAPSLPLANTDNTEQVDSDSGESSSNSAEDNTGDDDDEESYSDPLGVSKTSTKTSSNDASAAAFAAIAVASLATIGGAAYSLAKQNKGEE